MALRGKKNKKTKILARGDRLQTNRHIQYTKWYIVASWKQINAGRPQDMSTPASQKILKDISQPEINKDIS